MGAGSKPKLGLIEAPDGSGTGNNIVFPPRHGCRNEPGTVFLDSNPSAPASERWKWLNQFDGPGGFGLYALGSPDGINWTLMSPKPSFTHGHYIKGGGPGPGPGPITCDTQVVARWDSAADSYRVYKRFDLTPPRPDPRFPSSQHECTACVDGICGKTHDYCWHLGCILPKIASNNHADRRREACGAVRLPLLLGQGRGEPRPHPLPELYAPRLCGAAESDRLTTGRLYVREQAQGASLARLCSSRTS